MSGQNVLVPALKLLSFDRRLVSKYLSNTLPMVKVYVSPKHNKFSALYARQIAFGSLERLFHLKRATALQMSVNPDDSKATHDEKHSLLATYKTLFHNHNQLPANTVHGGPDG